jgi:hypothetical protein
MKVKSKKGGWVEPEHWLKPITLRLDDDYYREVLRIAEEDKTNPSAAVRKIVEFGLDAMRAGEKMKKTVECQRKLKAIRDILDSSAI